MTRIVEAGSQSEGFARRAIDCWVAAAGLALFAACAAGAWDGTVREPERRTFEAINDLPDALEPLMLAAQYLGVLAIGPLIAVVALALRRYRLAVAAMLITVVKLAAEQVVWQLVQRDRPGVTEPEAIVRAGTQATGLSFVSGHVVLVTALAWAIMPYLKGRWRLAAWAWWRWSAWRASTWVRTTRWM